jgi:hypothetical protein
MSKYITLNTKENPVVNVTPNLGLDLPDSGSKGIYPQFSGVQFPRLICKINCYQDRIILSQDGREFSFSIQGEVGQGLEKIFSLMDGTKSIWELQQICGANDPGAIANLVKNLDELGLLEDIIPLQLDSGIDTLLELEELSRELLSQSVEENPFWSLINSTAPQAAMKVFYGFAIEHYHFFSRKCCFQSPVLGFQGSQEVRELINELYFQTYGQDQLLIEALNSIGISSQELNDTIPLPETAAMCHGLTFWANFEPVFYLSILGILADNTFKNFELYLAACEWVDLASDFIEPIKQLVNTALKYEQQILSRPIFPESLQIDRKTKQRFREQTYLFVEMYKNFYIAIAHHYSSTPDLLRRVSAI